MQTRANKTERNVTNESDLQWCVRMHKTVVQASAQQHDSQCSASQTDEHDPGSVLNNKILAEHTAPAIVK